MDVGSAFPADAESLEAVEPGEGALDDPAVGAQAGAVPCSAAGDGRHDAAGADLVAVDVVVVPAVGEQRVRLPARTADPAADRRDRVEQRQELGDVVAVAAGQRDGQRDAGRVDQQMVLGARAGTVDRGRPGQEPPKSART